MINSQIPIPTPAAESNSDFITFKIPKKDVQFHLVKKYNSGHFYTINVATRLKNVLSGEIEVTSFAIGKLMMKKDGTISLIASIQPDQFDFVEYFFSNTATVIDQTKKTGFVSI